VQAPRAEALGRCRARQRRSTAVPHQRVRRRHTRERACNRADRRHAALVAGLGRDRLRSDRRRGGGASSRRTTHGECARNRARAQGRARGAATRSRTGCGSPPRSPAAAACVSREVRRDPEAPPVATRALRSHERSTVGGGPHRTPPRALRPRPPATERRRPDRQPPELRWTRFALPAVRANTPRRHRRQPSRRGRRST
jgi:hypothetical protein